MIRSLHEYYSYYIKYDFEKICEEGSGLFQDIFCMSRPHKTVVALNYSTYMFKDAPESPFLNSSIWTAQGSRECFLRPGKFTSAVFVLTRSFQAHPYFPF